MKNLTSILCLLCFGTLAQNKAVDNPIKPAAAVVYENNMSMTVVNAGPSNGYATPVMIQSNNSNVSSQQIFFRKVGQEQMPLTNGNNNFNLVGCDSFEYKGEYILITNKGMLGLLNKYGEKILPTVFKEILLPETLDGLFAVRKGKKWGFVNYTNKVMVPLKYDVVTAFNERNSATVTENGTTTTINNKGEFIIE